MPPEHINGATLPQQFSNKDFHDKKQLVGLVYHAMVTGMLDPHPEHRHMVALNIVMMVAGNCFPTCTGCGKKCEDTRCRDCKINQQGILGVL